MSAEPKVPQEASKVPPLRAPKPSDLCTLALWKFYRRHHEVFDLFFFNINLAERADRTAMIASKALSEIDTHSKEKYEELLRNPNRTFKKMQSFGSLQAENILIRLVDNFLCFLSECIQCVMLKRPEMLKSGEQIRIEDVLRFRRRRDLIEFIVERKINEISYGGIKEIGSFLRERTGLNLCEVDEEARLLTISIEIRNIFTHNRGIVNDVFLKKTRGLSLEPASEKGKRLTVGFDEIVAFANNLFVVAARLDEQAAGKFRVSRKRFGAWSKASSNTKPAASP